MILGIILQGILFIWFIYNLGKAIFVDMPQYHIDSDITWNVCCEKCKTKYNIKLNDWSKSHFHKEIYTPTTHYYAKKFMCPTCNKKVWAEVINYGEISEKLNSCAKEKVGKILKIYCVLTSLLSILMVLS